MTNVKDVDQFREFDHGFSYLTGLSDMTPRAMRAMMRVHSYTGRAFWKFYNDTVDMMKGFMHTKAKMVPIPGSGRAATAAILNNFLEPGEKLLMIDNGYWGRYVEVMAKTYGVDVVPLTLPTNRPIDPARVEDALRKEPNIKAVHITHVETESGILNPVRRIGEVVQMSAPAALYIVDSNTAFPGNRLEVDNWGIDLCYFVSHKGFNAPAGLNFVSVSERALKVFASRTTPPRDWSTSLQTLDEIWLESQSDGRHCMGSFPTIILQAMRAKLDLMTEMGEEKYLKKYELASRAVRMGIRGMTDPENSLMVPGPGCEACPGCEAPDPNDTPDGAGRFCSQTDASLGYPDGTDWKRIIDILEERYWLTCPHFGFGDDREEGYFYSKNGMRIGMINDPQHYPRNIIALITAIGFALQEAGIKHVRWDKGVEATNQVLKEMRETLDWRYYE